MSETQEPEALIRLLEGLRQASGSAHQLAHMQRNPQWLQIRDMLEAVRYNCQKLAQRRSLPNGEVLTLLDRRQGRMM